MKRKLPAGDSVILVDSTGLKIMGQGEWSRKKFGSSKTDKWIKLHLAFDYDTGQILAYEITKPKGAGTHDLQLMPALLKEVNAQNINISEVIADKAYDSKYIYDLVESYKGEFICPPKWDSVLGSHPSRDNAVKTINCHNEKIWKQGSGYPRRSLAETGMSQFKGLFGGKLTTKSLEAQLTQVELRIMIMNELVKAED